MTFNAPTKSKHLTNKIFRNYLLEQIFCYKIYYRTEKSKKSHISIVKPIDFTLHSKFNKTVTQTIY